MIKIEFPNGDPHGGLSMGSIYEITEIIEDTAYRLKTDIDPVKWEWNTRLKASMGYAEVVERRLSFSHPLWPNASFDQRKHTVVHEVVHLLAYAKYGKQILGRQHGHEWKEMMLEVGELPTRCHTVSMVGAVSVITGLCDCREHEIQISRVRRYSKRGGLKCKSCNTKILYELNGIV